MTPWLILFKNSFLANFLLSLKGEYVYEIMLRLNYNPKIILIISVSAAFLAQTVNFLIGLGIWKLYEKKVISFRKKVDQYKSNRSKSISELKKKEAMR